MMTISPSDKALRQEWRTPQDLWEVMNQEWRFQIDVAAAEDNALVINYIDKKTDALSKDVQWIGKITPYGITRGHTRAYCNPGFRNPLPWVQKAYDEVEHHPSGVVVVMGRVAPSTGWWAFCAETADEIRLLTPRPQFIPPPGIPSSSNAQENCLIVFRPKPYMQMSDRGPARIWRYQWK